MKVEYSYKWYLQTCKENGLNPDNPASAVNVELAKEYSKRMYHFMKYMETVDENYPDAADKIKKNLQQVIDQNNEKRIYYMLQALEEAEKEKEKKK